MDYTDSRDDIVPLANLTGVKFDLLTTNEIVSALITFVMSQNNLVVTKKYSTIFPEKHSLSC